MAPDRPPPTPESAYARYAPRMVAEKLRILRLLRALDRAGINPEDRPPVRAPLVRIAEIDALLAHTLEVIDRVHYCGQEPSTPSV